MRVEVKKTLIASNGKIFRVGDDIAFNQLNEETKYNDHYIVEITRIEESLYGDKDNNREGYIIGKKIEVNRNKVDGEKMFFFKDMKECF